MGFFCHLGLLESANEDLFILSWTCSFLEVAEIKKLMISLYCFVFCALGMVLQCDTNLCGSFDINLFIHYFFFINLLILSLYYGNWTGFVFQLEIITSLCITSLWRRHMICFRSVLVTAAFIYFFHIFFLPDRCYITVMGFLLTVCQLPFRFLNSEFCCVYGRIKCNG